MVLNIKILLILPLFVSFDLISSDDFKQEKDWEQFKIKFGKQYYDSSKEKSCKKNFIYINNFISDHNSNHAKKRGFELRINEHCDRTHKEMVKALCGLKPRKKCFKNKRNILVNMNNMTIPQSWDWRNVSGINFVTKPKNQGTCGCCYAFSATSAMESQSLITNYINKKTIPQGCDYSEQNLIDCSQPYGNDGCDGGDMDTCFTYVISNKGVNGGNTYPYQQKTSNCRYNNAYNLGTLSSFTPVSDLNEEQLKALVYSKGPITIGIYASLYFIYYGSGILNDPMCPPDRSDVNHAVTLIGYGQENGIDYWIIKNSFGEYWGENGFIRMIRNNNNLCGIAYMPTFITMTGSKTTDKWFGYVL